MPSHIYSMLGIWEDLICANLASKAAAESHGLPVAHQTDFLIYTYLQLAEDGRAKGLVDSLVPISGGLGSDTALAAIPALRARNAGNGMRPRSSVFAPASFRQPSLSHTSPAPSRRPFGQCGSSPRRDRLLQERPPWPVKASLPKQPSAIIGR